MTKAVIVEDEAVASRRLSRLLVAEGLEIIATISSLEELKKFLATESLPDLFFMDIHLSDGIVFDVLSNQVIETPIIFTTAYDQYAIKAFKQNSVDYLLKPIDEEELASALAKFAKLKPSVDLMALSALLTTKQVAADYRDRISVKVGDKIRSINISEVLFFYSSDKINYLYNHDGRAYPIDYSIEKIHKQLDPRSFFRVSRGYIISIEAIQDVIAYSNSRLKIVVDSASNHDIIVARDRVKEFKDWLG